MTKHTYAADGTETLTQSGYGASTTGSDFLVQQYTAMTYDSLGRVIKTVMGQ